MLRYKHRKLVRSLKDPNFFQCYALIERYFTGKKFTKKTYKKLRKKLRGKEEELPYSVQALDQYFTEPIHLDAAIREYYTVNENG